jgi:hypothetical protein
MSEVLPTATSPLKVTPQLILMAWLIPGYGLWKLGLKHRAILAGAILHGTFLAGLLLDGSVIVPDFHSGADGYNLIGILLFVVQSGAGFMAILSALPEFLGTWASVFPSREYGAYADLGQVYLLVSGGMNYFLALSFWSHLTSAQNMPEEAPTKASQQ